MDRIKVSLPSEFPFETTIAVRITDLNYGSHVGNDSFLSYLHEARVQFLAALGYSELHFEGTGLIMADAGLEFKKEIHYGDRIYAAVCVGPIHRKGFDLLYQLTKEAEDGSRILVARAKTGMLCYDYQQRKPVSVPADALVKLESMTGGR